MPTAATLRRSLLSCDAVPPGGGRQLLFAQAPRGSGRHGSWGRRAPCVSEALERRVLFASIVVTDLGDNTTIDRKVTLREAIQAAETDTSVDGSAAGAGADVITFAPALTSGGDATITLT